MNKVLFRQVHPKLNENGLSSSAFRPTPSDLDKLSVDCSEMTTAEESFQLHKKKTKKLEDGTVENLETDGAWPIERSLCAAENLQVEPDPVKGDPDQPDNKAHHLIDYTRITASPKGNPKNKNSAVAKRLRARAQELGRCWPK